MAERDQQQDGGQGASPQGDGEETQAREGQAREEQAREGQSRSGESRGDQSREVGRVGSPARGGEGGYGNDSGFATGTQGSQEKLSGGSGDRTDGGER